MLENNTYNLMAQMVEENKSLWRIKQMYREDAQHCKECIEFWNKLERQKEDDVRELEKLIREHVAVKAGT